MAGLQIEYLDRLSPERRGQILSRSQEDVSQVLAEVAPILAALKKEGDAESLRWQAQFKADVSLADLEASPEEIEAACRTLDPGVLSALKAAAANIEKFHRAQLDRDMWAMEIQPGLLAGRLTRPLDKVGCYIPGGLASYPSSALMNIIPARVAGVREIVAATPPGPEMAVNPATLAAVHLAGAQRLFKIGGPWAIGSFAYGTGLVPKVDKIVGPGNKYVTAAKLLVFGVVDIDSPAGPSEALILADETAEPRFLALDFLSQVEHDPEAAAVLVTPAPDLAAQVVKIIEAELPHLPRREIMEAALAKYSAVLLTRSLAEAVEFANLYAPEHLQIVTRDPFGLLPAIKHAGSIFLGPYAPVPVGTMLRAPTTCCPPAAAPGCFPACRWTILLRNPRSNTSPGRLCNL